MNIAELAKEFDVNEHDLAGFFRFCEIMLKEEKHREAILANAGEWIKAALVAYTEQATKYYNKVLNDPVARQELMETVYDKLKEGNDKK